VLAVVTLGLALRRTHASVVAICAVAAVVIAGFDVNRTSPREVMDVQPPILTALPRSAEPGAGRLFVYDYLKGGGAERYLRRKDAYPIHVPPGLTVREAQLLSQRLYPFPPVATRWGFEGSFEPDPRGLYPLHLADLVRLSQSLETTSLQTWLLRVGSVRHVVALHVAPAPGLAEVATRPTLFPEPARAFRVPDPLPRAYLVSGARRGSTAAELLAAAADLDIGREVLLHGLDARVAADPAFVGRVHALHIRGDRVRAEVEASGPGWLVLVDTYDAGWRVEIDGRAAPLLRANVAFRAVAVPAGAHTVEMVYRPTSVSVGLAVSIAALGVLVVLALRSRHRLSPDPGPAGA
jgi:hypothetical protein